MSKVVEYIDLKPSMVHESINFDGSTVNSETKHLIFLNVSGGWNH